MLEILEALIPRPEPFLGGGPPINVASLHHAGADYIKAGLSPALFKPYQAAVPQSSKRQTWGPWAGGLDFGKVVVKKDESILIIIRINALTPGETNSTDLGLFISLDLPPLVFPY